MPGPIIKESSRSDCNYKDEFQIGSNRNLTEGIPSASRTYLSMDRKTELRNPLQPESPYESTEMV